MNAVANPVVEWQVADGVCVVTLARPPVNALDAALLAQLDAALDAAQVDRGVSVLHLRSALKVFGAGADLALMQRAFADPAGPQEMLAVVRRMQQVFARLEALPLVTLAEIGGAALGGGFELALACDLRIAAHEARIGLPEAGLGLLPGAGGTQRLTRIVGESVARRLILGAETVDGAEAARLGLVHWAVPRGGLAAAAAVHARRLAALPRHALAANKRCIALAGQPGESGYAEELAATARLYDHPETRRRVTAFLDRRAAEPRTPTHQESP